MQVSLVWVKAFTDAKCWRSLSQVGTNWKLELGAWNWNWRIAADADDTDSNSISAEPNYLFNISEEEQFT
jgi:hypothetical protein